ncbi:MAG: OmpA family protein [Sodalinema sp.]|uniref:OmpA family protein n=1 Tax=Sodalinema sp. TaxID=3080550 RepID=UPI0012292BC4|nr:MAG: hypothetical protein EYR95_14590 [Phormidium sp. SL48-SHIP]
MSQSPPPDPNTARSRRDRRRAGRSAPSAPPSSSGSWLGAIAIFIVRLLTLGVSLSLGVIGGVVWAQRSPQANPEKPLSERWRVQIRQITNPPPSSPNPDAPPADLDRDQLQDTIVELQEQVTQLNRQLAALTPEEAPATEDATEEENTFEAQKTDIQSQVTLISTQLNELQAIVDPPEAIAPPRISPGMPLRLTLPSDILFSDSGEVLDPTRASILDRLLDELQTLEGATVYIGGYLDATDDNDASLEKTFEQAQQVEQYLASNTDTPLRWVSIGYGSSRFAASNNSPANRQRNRRIEIRVRP